MFRYDKRGGRISYLTNLRDSFKVLVFDKNALDRISKNTKATGYGFLTVIIAGLLLSASELIYSPNIYSYYSSIVALLLITFILVPIGSIIRLFIFFSIFHLFAKFIFLGKAKGVEYFRAVSSFYVIYWISSLLVIILQLINLVSIALVNIIYFIVYTYILVINTFVLNRVHKLSTFKSILLGIILPMLVILILIVVGLAIYLSLARPQQFVPQI